MEWFLGLEVARLRQTIGPGRRREVAVEAGADMDALFEGETPLQVTIRLQRIALEHVLLEVDGDANAFGM
jgi:hypothetical protein